MSDRGNQLNGLQHENNGNKTIPHRTSVIAEALKYEAGQGTTSVAGENTPSPKSVSDASPSSHYVEPVQASVFSAFGKDVVKEELDGFEGAGRPSNNTGPDKGPVNDMTKQCSMLHRMMEMDKTDIDPRDVHKLLPSAMLTSDSLDLRGDGVLGRMTQNGNGGMDLHSLLEYQALKFVAEHESKQVESKSEQGDDVGTSHEPSSSVVGVTATTTPPSQSSPELETSTNSPAEAQNTVPVVEPATSKASPVRSRPAVGMSSAMENHQQQKQEPNSPVTGWPAALVLGTMHPMNHALVHVSRTQDSTVPAPSPHVLYSESSTTTNPTLPNTAVVMNHMSRNTTTCPTSLILDWSNPAATASAATTPTTYAHPTNSVQQIYPSPQEDQHRRVLKYRSITSPRSESQNSSASPKKELSASSENNNSDNNNNLAVESGTSDQDIKEDPNSKNFKSLEAALAWCHVQHSQKQVPVVPKDDVRKLVDFQLNSGKPIRAPWYRPQTEKAAEQVEKKSTSTSTNTNTVTTTNTTNVVKRPMIPRPERPKKNSGNSKKQGTDPV